MKTLRTSSGLDLASELVIGADENGLGCIAGPLVVTAAIINKDRMKEIAARDSKAYNKNAKRIMSDVAKTLGFTASCIVEVDADTLTKQGYAVSLRKAFTEAIESLRCLVRPRCPLAVIDGQEGYGVSRTHALVKADRSFPIVSLASCEGKLKQMQNMKQLALQFPEYYFDRHNGYGTALHIAQLRQFGMVPRVHRKVVCQNALKKAAMKARSKKPLVKPWSKV